MIADSSIEILTYVCLIVTNAVSILSSFLFTAVRFAIFIMVKNSDTTEGGHTRSQDRYSYWIIRRETVN